MIKYRIVCFSFSSVFKESIHTLQCAWTEFEDWQLSSSNQSNYDPSTRLPYSIFSMVFQFGIPFVFISAIYISIYRYLKKHRLVKQ